MGQSSNDKDKDSGKNTLMTTIAFFGNVGVLHKGQQSTVVRVSNIAKKLRNHGYTCILKNTLIDETGDILEAIRNSDIVLFHRIQASRETLIDLKFIYAFLISKKQSKKLIFDFDDAIFLTHPLIADTFLSASDLVLAGSHYLYEHAAKLNSHAYLVPSAVDTDIFKPAAKVRSNDKCVIGWHGSMAVHQKNLSSIVSVMQSLGERYDLRFKLLGARGSIQFQNFLRRMVPKVELDFGPDEWVPYAELPTHLSDIDISVSPLVNNRWSKGKCAMKTLESMSLGIPVVASAVGEHNYIIRSGWNGFLANNAEEWIAFLSKLINDACLRKRIGERGREFVQKYYSLDSISAKVQDLIERVLIND